MSTPRASYMMPDLLHLERLAMNGMVPSAVAMRQLAQAILHGSAFKRKLVAELGQALASPVACVAADTLQWATYCRTGANVRYFRHYIVMGPADNTAATDPYAYIKQTPIGGATVNSTEVHLPYQSGTPTVDQNDLSLHVVDQACDEFTAYDLRLHVVDYARVLGWTCHELSDAGIAYADPRGYHDHAPIYDQNVYDILNKGSELRVENARHLALWSETLASFQSTTTTWNNMFGTGSAAPSATTAGWYLPTTFDRSRGRQVAVELAVLAQRTAGAGTGEARINDGTNQITITGIGATLQWYTTTGTIAAGLTKWDPQFRISAGGTTAKIYAMSLLERGA